MAAKEGETTEETAMTRSEIQEAIAGNMSSNSLAVEDLRVQPDPFEGWRIAVVSSGFRGRSLQQRKDIVLPGLDCLSIQWLDLLTPEEVEWAGGLFLNSSLEDLPFWAEKLAGSLKDEKIFFISDLEEDPDLPIIATFYSFKGGVGRSTALAYAAHILAKKGVTVLCVDMDLEAPGLAALYGKEGSVEPRSGLVYLLPALDQGERPDVNKHVIRVSEDDELYLLPAGVPNADYARMLNFIDVQSWYREERNPLRDLMEILKKDLTFRPDIIMLDARTGINSLSGPLLFDLADLAVIVFFPHPQTKGGTAALVRSLLASRSARRIPGKELAPAPRFIVSPIPPSQAPEVRERYQHRSVQWISDWLSVLEGRRSDEQELVESDITHFIPYREGIAVSDKILPESEITALYGPVAEWLQRFLPTKSEVQTQKILATSEKTAILSGLEFSAGAAEFQSGFLSTFVETETVNRALHPDIPLVLGRKGSGKTAVFRKLMEDPSRSSVVVLAPARLREDRGWMPAADGFKAAEDVIKKNDATWRELWLLYITLVGYWQSADTLWRSLTPSDDVLDFLGAKPNSELELLERISKGAEISHSGLIIADFLQQIDKSLTSPTLLLFDGLDTGFGNAEADRTRRRNSIEGLFSLMTDLGDRLTNLKFKVVLRDDIWRALRFENKSHLYGRSVRLSWPSQPDYFKVVLIQALQAPSLKRIVRQMVGGEHASNVANWSDQEVLSVWNILVGERMKGGNTAFTRNWVWNRLADGNGDRGPRALLQLFTEATELERDFQKKNPYEKSLIRPRALSSALPAVSQEAVSALREEFAELSDLLSRLTGLGRTPVEAAQLSGLEDQVELAKEVGLLAVYEGTEEDVRRYKVPDIYRIGLGLTRKGQA